MNKVELMSAHMLYTVWSSTVIMPAMNVISCKAQPSAQNIIMLGMSIFQKFSFYASSFLPHQYVLKEMKKAALISLLSIPRPKITRNLIRLEIEVATPMARIGSVGMLLSKR